MKSMAPRALLIDLDGVLRRWPAHDGALEASLGLPIGELRGLAFSAPLLTRAITGEITDEQWRAQVAADLKRRHPGVDAQVAVQAWSESPGEVAGDVLQVLEEEAAELRLVLVTNATSRLPGDLQALGLSDRFPAVVNSSVVGAAKPKVEIFQAALQAADCGADEALFVDDSVANVRAAQVLGIVSHLYVSPKSLRAFLRTRTS
jgi:putative hydrolase of the HAD superfamily